MKTVGPAAKAPVWASVSAACAASEDIPLNTKYIDFYVLGLQFKPGEYMSPLMSVCHPAQHIPFNQDLT